MAKRPKITRALVAEEAAAVVGLPRVTFLTRVASGVIKPDVFIGDRGGFTRAALRGKGANEPVKAFTPGQAAGIADMSRPAFLKHVAARRIKPDVFIGDRGGFSLALLVAFRNERKKSGAKKRGPQPSKRRSGK